MTRFRPALFLDRDGVLNVDQGYVCRVEDFIWIDGALDCIRAFKAREWLIFVVTNQSAIAFGSYTEADVETVHAHMLKDIRAAGGDVDAVYSSPWHPEATDPAYRKTSLNRKPGPGMLLQAMAEFPVDREKSFLIGDKETDLEAAKAAGITGFLFKGGNLHDYAEWALASVESGGR